MRLKLCYIGSMPDQVNIKDFFKAQTMWVEFWGDQKLPVPPFSAFLGLGNGGEILSNWSEAIVGPEGAKKIKMMLGPNGFAYLKAYQWQKQEN
jgi:hypothetical protein